jgi:hypothetical protein
MNKLLEEREKNIRLHRYLLDKSQEVHNHYLKEMGRFDYAAETRGNFRSLCKDNKDRLQSEYDFEIGKYEKAIKAFLDVSNSNMFFYLGSTSVPFVGYNCISTSPIAKKTNLKQKESMYYGYYYSFDHDSLVYASDLANENGKRVGIDGEIDISKFVKPNFLVLNFDANSAKFELERAFALKEFLAQYVAEKIKSNKFESWEELHAEIEKDLPKLQKLFEKKFAKKEPEQAQ